MGLAPPAVQRTALELYSRKATAVATNVPGPQMPLYMAGSQIREMMIWVPQNGSIGVGISLLSYHGRVHFGLIGDTRLIPDTAAVSRRYRTAVMKLLCRGMHAHRDGAVRPGGAGTWQNGWEVVSG